MLKIVSILLLFSFKDLSGFFHPLRHRHMERTPALTALTADTVGCIYRQFFIVRPHCSRHLILHDCQIIELVHHRNIDLLRAGCTVAAVSTLKKKKGVLEAVRLMLSMPSTLFDDMAKKLMDFPELKNMLKEILFRGREYAFERENPLINLGMMFGFLKNKNHKVMAANRIFETKLYNLFLSEEETGIS